MPRSASTRSATCARSGAQWSRWTERSASSRRTGRRPRRRPISAARASARRERTPAASTSRPKRRRPTARRRSASSADMDLWRIALRAIVAYVYVLLLARLAGKRVVSRATPIHFTVAVVVGDLFDDLFWAQVTAAEFLAAAGSLFFADAAVELASHKSRRLYRVLNGDPVVVMEHGREDPEAIRAEQLSENDLDHLLRLCGIGRDRREEVRLATMEDDHELSVLRERWAQ